MPGMVASTTVNGRLLTEAVVFLVCARASTQTAQRLMAMTIASCFMARKLYARAGNDGRRRRRRREQRRRRQREQRKAQRGGAEVKEQRRRHLVLSMRMSLDPTLLMLSLIPGGIGFVM